MLKERAYIDMPELEGETKYQDRILVYADILGFSQLVYDESKASIYAGILSTLCPSLEHNKKNAAVGASGISTAVISDTIIISAPFDGLPNFEKVIKTLCTLLQFMSVNNIIARGVITVGKIYHDGNIVFGPAMVTAHELERDRVHYPRFIIDPACVGKLIDANLAGDRKITFRKDTDGYYYYNFFYQLLLSAYSANTLVYNPFFDAIYHQRELIIDNLSAKHDGHILEKYIWMKNEWDRAIYEFVEDTGSNTAKCLLMAK